MPHSGWWLNLNKPTEGGLLQNCWGGDWDAFMDGKAAALYLLSPTCLRVRGVSVVCTFIPDRCSFSFIQKSLFWRLTPPSTQSCWCHHLMNWFFSPHSSKKLAQALESFSSPHFPPPYRVLQGWCIHSSPCAFTSAILTFIYSPPRACQHQLASSETASVLKY